MNRIRVGGIVMAALACLVVGPASAGATSYKGVWYPVEFEGSQVGEHVITVDGQTAKCAAAFFESASLGGPVTALDVYGEYTGACKVFGFVNATIKMNSCNYEFNEPGGNPYMGLVNIECNSSSVIEINGSSAFGTCEVRIGAQGGLNTNTYTNNGDGSLTTVTVWSGLTVNVVKDTGICPLSGVGMRTNSTYVGETLFEGNAGQDVFVE